MKYTITTEDEMEAKRLAKSTDMAIALFEIVYNSKKQVGHSLEATSDMSEVLDKVYENITDIIDDHGIVIDDIIE